MVVLDWAMAALRDRIQEMEPAGRRRGRRRLRLDPPLPTIYAIGDVHGCFRQMLDAEARIREDLKQSPGEAMVVYLGDYVDRGPDAAAVLDHLSKEHQDGLGRIALCGNHDEAFLNFIRDPLAWIYWLGPDFGGARTLASYGIDVEGVLEGGSGVLETVRDAIPQRHVDFLASLPVCLQAGRYLFVHAGVRPGVSLEAQTDEDLIWIREPFLSVGPGLPLITVHGHTPSATPEFRPGRIGIDTGCFATGRLTVLKIDASGARVL